MQRLVQGKVTQSVCLLPGFYRHSAAGCALAGQKLFVSAGWKLTENSGIQFRRPGPGHSRPGTGSCGDGHRYVFGSRPSNARSVHCYGVHRRGVQDFPGCHGVLRVQQFRRPILPLRGAQEKQPYLCGAASPGAELVQPRRPVFAVQHQVHAARRRTCQGQTVHPYAGPHWLQSVCCSVGRKGCVVAEPHTGADCCRAHRAPRILGVTNTSGSCFTVGRRAIVT